jgi:hypothetical protein
LKRLLAEGGCDHDLLKEKGVNEDDALAKHTLNDKEWEFCINMREFLHQFEGALDRIYKLIVSMQKKHIITHDELFELMSAIGHLGAKFFLIYNYVLKRSELNLRDREMYIRVKDPGF